MDSLMMRKISEVIASMLSLHSFSPPTFELRFRRQSQPLKAHTYDPCGFPKCVDGFVALVAIDAVLCMRFKSTPQPMLANTSHVK